MKGDTDFIIPLVFLVGLITGYLLTETAAEEIAIKNNCAQYNATTGDFEWKAND